MRDLCSYSSAPPPRPAGRSLPPRALACMPTVGESAQPVQPALPYASDRGHRTCTPLPCPLSHVIRLSSMLHANYNNLPLPSTSPYRHRHRSLHRPSPAPGITSPVQHSGVFTPDPAAWRGLHSWPCSSPKTLLSSPPKHITLTPSGPRFRRSFAITRPAEPGLSSPKRLLTIVGDPAQQRCYRPTLVPWRRVRIGARLRRAGRTLPRARRPVTRVQTVRSIAAYMYLDPHHCLERLTPKQA
jgi:hypothetical protein